MDICLIFYIGIFEYLEVIGVEIVTPFKHIRHARVMGLYLEVVTTTEKDF